MDRDELHNTLLDIRKIIRDFRIVGTDVSGTVHSGFIVHDGGGEPPESEETEETEETPES